MKKHRKHIKLKYKKERVVLSDVLPYEIPIVFSNRYFYRFLVSNGIEIKDNKIYWNCYEKALHPEYEQKLLSIIKLLFDCKQECETGKRCFDLNKNLRRIPFVYKITHKEKEFRELTVIHPKNQLEIIEFYEKYKELILYYSHISRFSIRKPDNITKYIYFRDKLHQQKLGAKDDSIEVYLHEYENLKTYFTYQKYTNIYRFYEDYRYHRAEKKYNKLLKFDISKCFDSIYTHSITWALLNKEIIKDNLKLSEQTFGGKFDEFMQCANYGETNGIIIGPEFSRIFAEIILQQIDKIVEIKLIQCQPTIVYRKDYECYRYVDDYFLFYNDDIIKDEIVNCFKVILKEFKMSISDSKTKQYDKPIITELSIAKIKILELIDHNIKFKIEDAKEDNVDENKEFGEIQDKFVIYLNSDKVAAKFKAILKETNVEYKDVLNYTLAIIARKIESIYKKFDSKFKEYSKKEYDNILSEDDERKKYNLEKRLTDFTLNILDFVFFLYTVYPKVNSTIKLTVILDSIISFYKGYYKFEKKKKGRFRLVNKELVFKKIQDEITLVLEKNKVVEYTQVETLYLLIVIKELGKEYKVNRYSLEGYFSIVVSPAGMKYFKNKLNAFAILVLLYYIENDNEYEEIKNVLYVYIKEKIECVSKKNRRKDTEIIILLFDLLACPYIRIEYKKDLLFLFDVCEEKEQVDILEFCDKQKYWFMKWTNFNLRKELNAKIGMEVYS